MSGFRIQISPPLPGPATSIEDRDLERFDFQHLDIRGVEAKRNEEYDISYWIGSELFGYYPASIVTVIGDLQEEWRLARCRTSHEMTLSGYAFGLQIEYDGDTATFLDLVELSKHGIRKPVAEPVSAFSVEEAFRKAFEQALSVVLEEWNQSPGGP